MTGLAVRSRFFIVSKRKPTIKRASLPSLTQNKQDGFEKVVNSESYDSLSSI